MKKQLLIYLFLFFIKNAIAQEPQKSERRQTAADYYWFTMPKLNYSIPDSHGSASRQLGRLYETEFIPPISPNSDDFKNRRELWIKNSVNMEIYGRLLREWGINFWLKFPDDPRRFEWLRLTMIYQPKYFANINEGIRVEYDDHYEENFDLTFDTIAKGHWLKIYPQFRKEYLSSSKVTIYAKGEFLKRELTYDLFLERWRLKSAPKYDVKNWLSKGIYYAEKHDVSPLVSHLDWIFTKPRDFGLNDSDLKIFLKYLLECPISSFNEFARQKKSLMNLKEVPLHLIANTYNGNKLNIKDYRGKLVLVDFWGLGCSSCIAKMPEIKDVYQKYKNQGFEVISACFIFGSNDKGVEFFKDEKTQIANIHKKIGADWPLIFLGKPHTDEIWTTYGFQSVPQLMLLDEQGKLLHYNGDMYTKGGLEELVKRHLSNKLNHK